MSYFVHTPISGQGLSATCANFVSHSRKFGVAFGAKSATSCPGQWRARLAIRMRSAGSQEARSSAIQIAISRDDALPTCDVWSSHRSRATRIRVQIETSRVLQPTTRKPASSVLILGKVLWRSVQRCPTDERKPAYVDGTVGVVSFRTYGRASGSTVRTARENMSIIDRVFSQNGSPTVSIPAKAIGQNLGMSREIVPTFTDSRTVRTTGRQNDARL